MNLLSCYLHDFHRQRVSTKKSLDFDLWIEALSLTLPNCAIFYHLYRAFAYATAVTKAFAK